MSEQLAESFSRYEKLKIKYEYVCHRLDAEIQALAATKLKLKEVENELEETIEIVRKDMAQRCISKNAAEDLLTLSSQLISKDHNPNNSIDILHQFDWNSLFITLNVNMTVDEINQLRTTLIQIKNSYDILCSRLFLECRARVEIEKILNNTKDDLESIKNQIISEVKIRNQVHYLILFILSSFLHDIIFIHFHFNNTNTTTTTNNNNNSLKKNYNLQRNLLLMRLNLLVLLKRQLKMLLNKPDIFKEN